MPPHRLQIETNATLIADDGEKRRKHVRRPFLVLKHGKKWRRRMRQSLISICGRMLERRQPGDRHDYGGPSLPVLGLPRS